MTPRAPLFSCGLSRGLLASFVLASIASLAVPLEADAAPVGTVIFVLGDARLTGTGASRAVKKGDSVEEGETLVTARNASVQLRMIDQGFIAVRPDTTMKFDEYKYSGREDGNERGVLSVASGGFRTITGVIGRLNKQNYTVKTPTATIGIRGTDHEVIHIPVPAAGVQGIGQPGSYDKVNVGAAFIQTDVARVNVNANQVGYAPAANVAPQLLPRIPEFFRATPPPAQRTAQQGQGQQGQGQGSSQAEGGGGSEGGTVRESATVDSPGQIASVVADAGGTGFAASSTPTVLAAVATPTVTPTVLQDSVPIVVTSSTGGTAISLTGTTTTSPSFSDNTRVRNRVYYTVPSTTSGSPNRYFSALRPLTAAVPGDAQLANTNYLLTTGSLTTINDTSYALFQLSTPYTGTDVATPAGATGQLDHVMATFSGGTAAETFSDTTRGLIIGRIQGGTIKLKNLATGTETIDSLGLTSAQWTINQVPQAGLALTGRYHYLRFLDGAGTPTFATRPTDSYGNVGTLMGARLTLNFNANVVTAGVRTGWTASGPGGTGGPVILLGGVDNTGLNTNTWSFNASSGDSNPFSVGCQGTGCLSGVTYGGRLEGGLTGSSTSAANSGAFFRYTFNTRFSSQAAAVAAGRQFDEYYTGLVGFQQGPAINPPAAGTGNTAVVVAYLHQPGGVVTNTRNFTATPAGISFDSSANLTRVLDDGEGESNSEAIATIAGGTGSGPTNAGAAISFPGTGISFGRWANNPQLTGIDFSGSFTNRAVLGSLYWIKAPEVWPFYLPEVLTGTFSYAFDGGAVIDRFGNTGTVTSSGISVDFTNAKVAFGLTATLGPRSPGVSNRVFQFSGSGIRLDGNSWFAGSNQPLGSATHNLLSVSTLNGGAVFSNVNGQLTGIGANGAIMAFAASGNDPSNSNQLEQISGVAAYKTTEPSGGLGTISSYRIGLLGIGQHPNSSARSIDGQYNYSIEAEALAPERVAFNSSSLPVAFDGRAPVPCNTTCAGGGNAFVNNIPVRVSIQPADMNFVNAALSQSRAPATIVDSGVDSESGATWGRYTGGYLALRDRTNSAAFGFLDVTTQSAHFLMSGNQAGPTVLPITGTASYALVGATSPTNNLGNVGTLGSVNLSVDFANKLVTSVGVNATVAGNAWAASATNLPIQQGMFFQAEKKLGETAPKLIVTVNGSGTSTAGQLMGAFVGATGRSNGMGYSLHDSSLNQTVTGVVVTRRPQ